LVTDSDSEPLQEPIQVMIENLSNTGMLIQSPDERFETGTLLQIEFNINGKNVMLYGEVVRLQTQLNDETKYGCKLYFRS